MARLLVTRAMPEAEETAGEILRLGHEAVIAPMRMTILLDEPPPDRPETLIATSANALRGLLPEGWTDLPIHCVGEATTRAASEAGFTDIRMAGGNVRSLLERIDVNAARTIVYLAGEPRRPDIEDHFRQIDGANQVRIWLRYRMERAETLPPSALRALADAGCDAILHFSSESADALFALAEAQGALDAALTPVQACLSPAVAATVAGWGEKRGHQPAIAVAEARTGASLIDAALRGCGAGEAYRAK